MRCLNHLGFKLLALVAFPFSAFAQSNGDAQACMGIADPTARLACFDGLVADEANTEAAAATVAPWTFEVASDTLSGGIPLARNTALRMEPEATPATQMNIRCMNGRVEGYLVWGVPILPDGVLSDSGAVIHMYRIDQNAPVRSIRWGISSTGTASFFTEEAGLIKQLTNAGEFVVQVHPEGGSPITAVFDVSGGLEPINEVLTACGIGVEDAGRQGLWGIEQQPVGGITPLGSNSGQLQPSQSGTGYRPSNSWQYNRTDGGAYAFVPSDTGRSSVSLSCVTSRPGVILAIESAEGWTVNEPVSLLVDNQVFAVEVDYNEYEVLLSDNSSLFVSDRVINAFGSGQSFSLTGPATAQMAEGARIFSLSGSNRAIQQMRTRCGL